MSAHPTVTLRQGHLSVRPSTKKALYFKPKKASNWSFVQLLSHPSKIEASSVVASCKWPTGFLFFVYGSQWKLTGLRCRRCSFPDFYAPNHFESFILYKA
eukprot:832015-Pelagomonas_calceolata.AAC.3